MLDTRWPGRIVPVVSWESSTRQRASGVVPHVAVGRGGRGHERRGQDGRAGSSSRFDADWE